MATAVEDYSENPLMVSVQNLATDDLHRNGSGTGGSPTKPKSPGTGQSPKERATGKRRVSRTESPAAATSKPKLPSKMQWRQGRLIGSGAFGKVYLGMDERSGKLIAAKQFTFDVNDEEIQRRISALQREIQIMKKIQHENVVNYLGADKHGETGFYIFMEYVPGGSLLGLLTDCGALGERTASFYMAQVLTGVSFLHASRVVHRDIKCGNVLVTVDGVIKLADFGSAQLKEPNQAIESMEGTANWMAPEVVRNEAASFASDIWSLGCTLIEMLTAKPPWEHLGSNFKVMSLVATADSQPPLPPDLEISLDCMNFLALCLEPDPAHRPTAQSLMTHPFVIRHLAASASGSQAGSGDFQASFYNSFTSATDITASIRRASSAVPPSGGFSGGALAATMTTVTSESSFLPPLVESPSEASLSPSPQGQSLQPNRLLQASPSMEHVASLNSINSFSFQSRSDVARSVSTLSAASLKTTLSGKQQQSIVAQVFRNSPSSSMPGSLAGTPPSSFGGPAITGTSPVNAGGGDNPLTSNGLMNAVVKTFGSEGSSGSIDVVLDHPEFESVEMDSVAPAHQRRPSDVPAIRGAYNNSLSGSSIPDTDHTHTRHPSSSGAWSPNGSTGGANITPSSPKVLTAREQAEERGKIRLLVAMTLILSVVVVGLIVALVLTSVN